jgi:hypothetical protein
MSYQVYDENGYVGDFATTKGFNDFMEWCKSTEDVELIQFAENGIYIFPEAIKESLEKYDPPLGDIRKTYDDFLALLPRCEGVVMISDGLNDDLEDYAEV